MSLTVDVTLIQIPVSCFKSQNYIKHIGKNKTNQSTNQTKKATNNQSINQTNKKQNKTRK